MNQQVSTFIPTKIITGWWLTYPSEKWWTSSVGMMKFPTEWKVIIHSCSKPPTSLSTFIPTNIINSCRQLVSSPMDHLGILHIPMVFPQHFWQPSSHPAHGADRATRWRFCRPRRCCHRPSDTKSSARLLWSPRPCSWAKICAKFSRDLPGKKRDDPIILSSKNGWCNDL